MKININRFLRVMFIVGLVLRVLYFACMIGGIIAFILKDFLISCRFFFFASLNGGIIEQAIARGCEVVYDQYSMTKKEQREKVKQN
jgi:hypothetical protein